MTNPTENSTGSNPDPFAHFHDSVKKEQDLKRLITRKALDLPNEDDPMNIDQSRHYHGERPVVSMVKAALLAAGIGTAGWFASTMLRPDAEQVTPVEDTNTRYELRFDD